MIDELYQKNILRHAATACRAGSLADAEGRAALQSPLCGDHIVMEVIFNGDRIGDLAYNARACVLCQASASIIGEVAIGKTPVEINAALLALSHMLKGSAAIPRWPADDWAALEVFSPVTRHANRHICVTLPFEALNEACRMAHEKA